MSKVLILGCGTQGMVMAKSISKAGHLVYLLGEKNNYADASRYVYKKEYTTLSPSSKEFLDKVVSMIVNDGIETIVPMGDVFSEFLSINKRFLQKYVKYVMPDNVVFQNGVDKNKLMRICQDQGYPHPFTYNSNIDIFKIPHCNFKFPLLIKPNITCGGRGMTLVENYEELKIKYPIVCSEYGDCHLQQYVRQGGAQVEVQLYVDKNRKLVNSSVIYKYRWYPEKGGSSCCAVSVKNEKIVNTLYHLLVDLSWVGFADFDTIEDPVTGDLLIMELNPRVPACVKCAIEAGINWGEIIVNEYLNQPQKEYSYREGEVLRHFGFEVLWFLKSPNRFKTKPNWFKFLGKHIHYQDMNGWSDPMPFIKGTFRNIKKVLSHTEKEKIVR